MNQTKPSTMPVKGDSTKASFRIISGNSKIIAQFILTFLFIGLAIWFIKHEKAELKDVGQVLTRVHLWWFIAGLMVAAIYILLQGMMYVASFASVGTRVALRDAVILFLKRNFVSVFLPAGGVSSLAFFNRDIEKKGATKTQIFFASSIYAFVGILTVVIVAVPAFLIAIAQGGVGAGKWLALAGVVVLLVLVGLIYLSIMNQGILYSWLIRLFPSTQVFLEDLQNNKINRNHFLLTILYSTLIEIVGIAHVFIAMEALNLIPTLLTAVLAYIIVVIFLIISPFLRGLGAIEVSMTYILIQTGIGNVEAIAATLLFRFFEFWLPLLAGVVSFLLKIDKLLMRILPAILIFALGIINIISVLTPAIEERVSALKDFLLLDTINFSNTFVLVIGLFLLVTAAFLLKGIRSSWWLALFLSFLSIFGHIAKGIDWEESLVAVLVVVALISTRKEYYVKTNPRFRTVGLQTAMMSVAAVLIYGTIGFYFLDQKHFQINFGIFDSIKYTLQNYFLIGSNALVPADAFARDFIVSIKLSGFGSIAFVIYAFVRPYVFKTAPGEDEIRTARELTRDFGHSSLDYFKTYSDKLIFTLPSLKVFLAYRVSGNFAIVLEDPVAAGEEEMKACIGQFTGFCYDNGLKELYYRVPATSLPVYRELSKKSLFLGQEGVVDLATFSLEGGERKSLRNAIRKVTDTGLKTNIYNPPLTDGLLQKLRAVSDEWLRETGHTEIVFSQGMFVEKEVKNQTVITIENKEEKIIAFLNIIPDFAKDEGTYDLLRKTLDAPNGTVDFMIVEMFNYFRSIGIQYVNLGFAAMGGLDDPHTFSEQSMKFAYEKIRSFSHFKGLREYKEKFSPVWYDKYLIYNQDYDLLQAPAVLSKVIKP